MGDACCGSVTPTSGGADVADERDGRWRTGAAAVAAVAWLVGIVFELTNAEAAASAAFVVAIVAGGGVCPHFR